MKNVCLLPLIGLFFSSPLKAQESTTIPCSESAIIARQVEDNPNAVNEMNANHAFIKSFIQDLFNDPSSDRSDDRKASYIIPVVLHVFHNGDDGKISLEQAQSGIDVLNTDMNGLNLDWKDIDPAFDSIKATLDIQFCLASIDPDGNPTTGVNYYDDALKMLNKGDLFVHAWDNFKYLNFYLPKYTDGAWSLFTAYAYYPSLSRVENNIDGIFYSSIRWGYGAHSELEDGQDWASVVTHEVGHWLDLRHTFENGCTFPGDYVDDTPYTTGGSIEVTGCNNHDKSCGVSTNGENYMDYNHDCKKMFTQGQVDRMIAALNLDARSKLWSEENLIATGCKTIDYTGVNEIENNILSLYPNPASSFIQFNLNAIPERISISNTLGEVIQLDMNKNLNFTLYVEDFSPGIYFFQIAFENGRQNGKFIVE